MLPQSILLEPLLGNVGEKDKDYDYGDKMMVPNNDSKTEGSTLPAQSVLVR